MIKKLKLCLVYIFITAIFLILCEFLSYNFIYGNLFEELTNYSRTKKLSIIWKNLSYKTVPNELEINNNLPRWQNKDIPYNENSRPILILGCSYTYGQGIDKDKTLQSLLQKNTGRRVDNISYLGFGPDNILQHINYLHRFNLLSEYKYEYVIYTIMFNNIKRVEINNLCWYLTEKCKIKRFSSFKNRLIYLADKLYTVKMIKAKLFIKNDKNRIEYNKFIVQRIFRIIKQDIPDVKCIFLIYDDVKTYDIEKMQVDSLNKDFWKYLDKDNVKIFSTKELVGDILYKDEYKLVNDPFQTPHHPNDKAWGILVSALTKKIDLQ